VEISYTMLSNFMQCEYCYYLRYVKRIPIKEGAASVYGTAVHRAIKIGYDNNLTKADDWASVFKSEWVTLTSSKDIVYTSEGEYLKKFKQGQELLRKYYNKYVKKHPAPIVTEFFFGRSNPVHIGRHIVIGVLDQIDAAGNVIDYKTGAKPTVLELDLDLQFTLYSYAYRHLFGKEENGLILRHLGTMRDMETKRCDEDFAILESEINKIERKIKTNVFVRNIGRGCARCYFLEECLGKERKIGRW